ncbi:GAF domain-containing protein [candidate division WOR-3 bacterium]|nr:GAF domain-containing protein [candidate division WOR-3 bacterium]
MNEKPDFYKIASNEIDKILSGNYAKEEKLKALCDCLAHNFELYDWVGFYRVREDDTLELGPFTGEPTEHKKIPMGKGVCGRAFLEKKTLVIGKVENEENYLSCSPKVKSEIVVPIYKNGGIVAEIDIDSHHENAFDEKDRKFLEITAEKTSSLF